MTHVINAVLRNIVARLLLYYGAVALAFTGLFRAFPKISAYVNAERLRGDGVSLDLDPTKIAEGAEQAQRGVSQIVLDPYTSVPVIVALVMVVALTVPVAWVYRWTRNPARYSASIAHALLVLPLAITLVVFLVKGSLALAFSLAGIVAAVRFRTALSESEDAVYMFVVIGIGLAAGVQLANVAFIASIFFNFVALLTWYLNFAARPALLNGWSLVPEEPVSMVESAATEAPEGSDKARYNTRVRVPTTDLEVSQKAAVPILDHTAKSWRIAQVSTDERGRSVVEYDARLKGSADVAAFARDLEDSAFETGRVEVKKIKKDKTAPEAAVRPTPPPRPEPAAEVSQDLPGKKKDKKKNKKVKQAESVAVQSSPPNEETKGGYGAGSFPSSSSSSSSSSSTSGSS